MEIREFAEEIKTRLEGRLENVDEITVDNVTRNNSVALMALFIKVKEFNVSPVIYLEEFYKLFCEGWSLEKVADEIVEVYERRKLKDNISCDWIKDWEQVKGKIIFKVINREKNRELLKMVPHKAVLDLAMVFMLVYSEEGTILVHDNIYKLWNVTIEELEEAAMKNTVAIRPMKMRCLEEMICKELGCSHEFDGKADCGIWILTNEQKLFGAATMFYPGLLDIIGDTFGSDFYIIPSSTHEVLILQKEDRFKPEAIKEMIREINATVVQEEEILSDNLYCYHVDGKTVEVVGSTR